MLTRTATVDDEDFYFKHWIGIRNGYYYQLIVFGDKAYAGKIDSEAEKVFKGFSQTDPDRVYTCTPAGPESNIRSGTFSYILKGEGTTWKPWKEVKRDTDFGEKGLTPDAGHFMITPVCLVGLHPDMDMLSEAFLRTLDYSIDTVQEIHRQSNGNLQSRSYACSERLDGTDFLFRLRIIRSQGYAYLLTGWMMDYFRDHIDLIDQIFDRFEPLETAAITDPETLTDRQKETHAFVFNQIGMQHFEKNEFRRSATYFKLAGNFDSFDTSYLTNSLSAYSRCEDYDRAFQLLQSNFENHKYDQEIQSWKAFLHYMLDDEEVALRIYESLFSNGYRSDEDFGYYLSLLRKQGKHETGLHAISAYFEDGDTPAAACHKSRIYFDQGLHDQAVSLLKNAMEDMVFNLDLAYELDNHYYEMGWYDESIALCNRMIDMDRNNPWAYFRKSKSQYQLNWYRQAKETIEKAKKIEPGDEDINNLLDHISGMLGEGSNYLVKEKIEPVPIPDEYIPQPGNAAENTAGYQRDIGSISRGRGKRFSVLPQGWGLEIRILHT